ncbi:thiolase family protein [Thalassobacter stenotrophicus]|uniref:Acetyl-CoA acetyltransferase n=2 Tax=Thalassobacter stenotrophicus TaxID=266809 RepID=A0A0P1EWN9_9RHOB|nr:acetyl-CoA C-acyltransferase [Thalassobacter stenotrophicus]PVZ47883.1 acetyl-CoA C-acyltransferase [Thalassobacter stenotrophicus]CUH59427.1 Acetyl-CoA acetyltransferase [Thalassobacter stenotrophicus]SHI83822.1 acetyl-CoA C-acetyltransferase [Thalassobacter stenotrophicus DSM 16310]
MKDVFIVGAARTPMGGFQGVFRDLTTPELGAAAIQSALEGGHISVDAVDEVLMGCVLPAGLGQAPARQAAMGAGLSINVPCTTVNKVCGSGMKTAMLAFDQIRAGTSDVVVAGGMESMSNAPYLSAKTRAGARLGHASLLDHMFTDGLEDAYQTGTLMGVFAEQCAEAYQFTRADQDAYAIASLNRSLSADAAGHFASEISPVTLKTRKGENVVTADEQPQSARPDKIPQLKPAFKADGTVTAANSSSISDGASAVVLASAEQVAAHGFTPRARICGHATFAHAPDWFTTAPIHAAKKLLDQLGWGADDVDLWEVNEAFAVVAMAFIRDMDLSHEKVNVHGGACALGHPIGASGSRILVTLLNALETHDQRRGMAVICLGGGEATAVAIERV